MKRTFTEAEVEIMELQMTGFQSAETMVDNIIRRTADMLEIEYDDAHQFLKDFNTPKQLLDTIGGEVYCPPTLAERLDAGDLE